MTTENLPVRWDEELAKQAQDVASMERPSVGKISLQSGVMQYMGVAVPGNAMELIILTMAFERRYDTKPYDAMNIQPPDCFSLSLDDSDSTAPWPTIEEPQNEVCITCPKNQWQPNPRRVGKNHKPCKERRRLIVVPKNCLETGIAAAEMAMLTVPVTSLRHWGTYVNLLSAQYRRPPWGVITRVSVTPDTKNQFNVKFEATDVIAESHLGELHAKITLANEAALQPWDVIPLDQRPPEQAPKGPTKY